MKSHAAHARRILPSKGRSSSVCPHSGQKWYRCSLIISYAFAQSKIIRGIRPLAKACHGVAQSSRCARIVFHCSFAHSVPTFEHSFCHLHQTKTIMPAVNDELTRGQSLSSGITRIATRVTLRPALTDLPPCQTTEPRSHAEPVVRRFQLEST